ncbi:MAG: hypothetical protein GX055_06875 [Desulfovibrionales bacterium]|nr:hypothetical protein [Desulfovibrionales bacterium]
MAESIDEITIDWTDEEGVQKVREIKKEVLSRGAWATVMFAYQEAGRGESEFGPVKFRVGRYQKRNGRFMPQSKFNISSVKQANQVVEFLTGWIQEFDDEE